MGGWHRGCWAHHQAARQGVLDEAQRTSTLPAAPDPDAAAELPTFDDIARLHVNTIEWCPAEALGLADAEYRRLLANVVLFNMEDAWPGAGAGASIDPALAAARAQAATSSRRAEAEPAERRPRPKSDGLARAACARPTR